jgi:hypothetical protein
MNANVAIPQSVTPVASPDRVFRGRLRTAYFLAGLVALVLLINGLDYYWLPQAERALSPKHPYLKPSGTAGLYLGRAGFFLFLALYLYPLRKRWTWLGRQGNSKRWLDVHVLLGLTAPIIITFHSSFKFSGIAGIAYWVMVVVALSGVIGRYIYTQIPRSLTSVEVALKEAQEQSAKLAGKLNNLGILSEKEVAELIGLPDARATERMSLLVVLWKMILFDLTLPLRVRALRQEMMWSRKRMWSLIGFKRGENAILERTIAVAREQAVVAKKTLFLSKSHRLFHLWHIVHRPFSYSFALLASIHIILMLLLGYY